MIPEKSVTRKGNGLKINEYQEKAWSTALPESQNHSYVNYGLVGEVGEFFGKIAKIIRDGHTESLTRWRCASPGWFKESHPRSAR